MLTFSGLGGGGGATFLPKKGITEGNLKISESLSVIPILFNKIYFALYKILPTYWFVLQL